MKILDNKYENFNWKFVYIRCPNQIETLGELQIKVKMLIKMSGVIKILKISNGLIFTNNDFDLVAQNDVWFFNVGKQ